MYVFLQKFQILYAMELKIIHTQIKVNIYLYP